MKAEIDDKGRIVIITNKRDEFGEMYQKETLYKLPVLRRFSIQLVECLKMIDEIEGKK